MQENPFENLDSHEHIPPSSESAEQPPRTKRVMRHTQQRFAETIDSADSDEMAEYEKYLLQNSLNKKMLREDEKDQYRNALLQDMDKLIDIGLLFNEDDGKYYFHNLASKRQWPRIGGKNLVSFPNTEFLREHGIIDQDARSMDGKSQIEKLFEVFFGVEKIATEEDYKKLFASQLEGIVPELEKIGLELSEGKYYFGDLQRFPNWPNIEGKHLRSFPNAEFLIKYKIIGQNNAFMTNRSQLAKLFTVLGFEVWYEPPKSRKK